MQTSKNFERSTVVYLQHFPFQFYQLTHLNSTQIFDRTFLCGLHIICILSCLLKLFVLYACIRYFHCFYASDIYFDCAYVRSGFFEFQNLISCCRVKSFQSRFFTRSNCHLPLYSVFFYFDFVVWLTSCSNLLLILHKYILFNQNAAGETKLY